MPGLSVYSSTSAAMRGFARAWSLELKERDIRANVVAPGTVMTRGLVGLAPDEESFKALLSALVADIPLGRIGEANEVAEAVLLPASPAASFVDGETAQV
jgi:NAD(P)-dependent dehydrogenase (short-subunit alcohol dehydrogenase family)